MTHEISEILRRAAGSLGLRPRALATARTRAADVLRNIETAEGLLAVDLKDVAKRKHCGTQVVWVVAVAQAIAGGRDVSSAVADLKRPREGSRCEACGRACRHAAKATP